MDGRLQVGALSLQKNGGAHFLLIITIVMFTVKKKIRQRRKL